MSNVTVQYTLFVNLDDEGNEEIKSYGYRVYTEFDETTTYNNLYSSFEQLRKAVNKENISFVLKYDYPGLYDGSQRIEFNGEFLE